jgi:hypothetical protein
VNLEIDQRIVYQSGGCPSYLVLEIKSKKLLLAFAMFQLCNSSPHNSWWVMEYMHITMYKINIPQRIGLSRESGALLLFITIALSFDISYKIGSITFCPFFEPLQ